MHLTGLMWHAGSVFQTFELKGTVKLGFNDKGYNE